MVELQSEPWGTYDLQVQEALLTRVPSYSPLKSIAGMLCRAIPGWHGFSDSHFALRTP